MRLRHISRKKVKWQKLPSGAVASSHIGEVIEVSDEDGAWLLTLRARNCSCGGKPRPGSNGLPVYEQVMSAP